MSRGVGNARNHSDATNQASNQVNYDENGNYIPPPNDSVYRTGKNSFIESFIGQKFDYSFQFLLTSVSID